MLKLLVADLKMIARNRQALFWSLMFPLIFTIIFGLFFGGNNSMNGSVNVVNKSNSTLGKNIIQGIKDAKIFNIQETDNLEDTKKLVEKNKISAAIYIPSTFDTKDDTSTNEVEIIYDPGSTQAVGILSNYINTYLTQASFKVQNAKQLYTVKQSRAGSSHPFSYFDFVLAGIFGMALMNSSIMGMAVGISKYKEDKILKRITTTPLKTWKFLVAEVLSRLILNAAQIGLILVVGISVFNGHIYGSYSMLLAMIFVGALLFQLIGFTLAAFAKNTNAADGMATAITVPMMFLAGVFFPIDSLPVWLQKIVQFLPLAPLLRMIRGISIDGVSPFSNLINPLIVAGWIAIALVVSLWKFKLSEE